MFLSENNYNISQNLKCGTVLEQGRAVVNVAADHLGPSEQLELFSSLSQCLIGIIIMYSLNYSTVSSVLVGGINSLIKESPGQFITGFNFLSVGKFFSNFKLIAVNSDLRPKPNWLEVL